jgi:hypothetical protein
MCEVNMQVNVQFDGRGRVTTVGNDLFSYVKNNEEGRYGGTLAILGSPIVRNVSSLEEAFVWVNEVTGVAGALNAREAK